MGQGKREGSAPPEQGSERALVPMVSWLIGAFVLALWVFFALWAHNYHASNHEHAAIVLDRQRSAVAEQVDSVFRLSEAFLAGADVLISGHHDRDPRVDPNFAQYVRSFQQVTNKSMMVRLVDEAGIVYPMLASDSQPGSANVADRDYFQRTLKNAPGKLLISAPFHGRVTGKWVMPITTRLSRPSHDVSIIMVALELALFDDAFARSRLPDGGAISLIRSDGILLARAGARPVELGIDMSRAPTFTEGLAHADHGMVTTESPFTDRIPRLVAFGRVAKYPLVIAVSQSIDAIDAQGRQDIYAVAVVLSVVTLAAGLARWRILLLLEKLSGHRQLLKLQASRDDLTGAMNRRYFLESCDRAINRARRYPEKLAFIIIDIDHFKTINDAHGHPAGDLVLESFAATCRECLREVDHFGRLGGEEFGILLPNTNLEGAVQLAERIRLRLAAAQTPWQGTPLGITASFGVTEITAADTSLSVAYLRADSALYQAKMLGRNRSCSMA